MAIFGNQGLGMGGLSGQSGLNQLAAMANNQMSQLQYEAFLQARRLCGSGSAVETNIFAPPKTYTTIKEELQHETNEWLKDINL